MSPSENAVGRAAVTAIGAAAVWLVGITPVPRAYTERDPARRLELLRAGRRSWIVGEHLAAAGTAAVPAAFARAALALPAGPARTFTGVAAGALAAGAPFFVWEIAVRTSDIERFAYRRMAGWPFEVYAWLHVAALGSLAGALWTRRRNRREAAAVGAVALGSAVALVRTGDMVPAAFYLAEQVAAASLLRRTDE
ncbi:hypothetical protein [Sinomonas halotolerans]|uniref:Uncharacterized protein n=1 Tax=Sinomonas halotolerans TaxID=1644133 RepID=A0ABU9X357_9MICC